MRIIYKISDNMSLPGKNCHYVISSVRAGINILDREYFFHSGQRSGTGMI